MMTRSILATMSVVAAAAVLGACGEQPQVVVYKQGTYQGKPDQPAWAAAPWNGNKAEWDVAMRTRAQNQNEYKRTN